MTKASILHLIDRLQFPWLTASISQAAVAPSNNNKTMLGINMKKLIKKFSSLSIRKTKVFNPKKLFGDQKNFQAKIDHSNPQKTWDQCRTNNLLSINYNCQPNGQIKRYRMLELMGQWYVRWLCFQYRPRVLVP